MKREVATEITQSPATSECAPLICAISNAPDGNSIAKIKVDVSREINNNGKRIFKYNIVEGGRALWQSWMDSTAIFMSLNAAEAYRIQLSAFPSDPGEGYGYVELVEVIN